MSETGESSADRGTVRRLTERMLTGAMSHEEFEHFEQILLRDPAAQLTYLEHLNVHAQLSLMGGAAEALGDQTIATAALRSHRSLRRRNLLLALATLCGTFLLAVWVHRSLPPENSREVVIVYTPKAPVRVASVATALNPVWNGPHSRVKGSDIFQGEVLELASGRAEIRFLSGVLCYLEAPVALTFTEKNELHVERGAVLLDVPPQAIGFSVVTPHGTVVDLGTSFGVDASEATEVQVFQGKVKASSGQGQSSDALPALITQQQAVRFDEKPGSLTSIPYNSSRFEQLLAYRRHVIHLAGDVDFLEDMPADFSPGRFESDRAQLIHEQSNVLLRQDLDIDFYQPGLHQVQGSAKRKTEAWPAGGQIPAGTKVNSFVVHIDPKGEPAIPVGTQDQTFPLDREFSMTFQQPVVGVIAEYTRLATCDAVTGRPGRSYDDVHQGPQGRVGREFSNGTSLEISDDLKTVTIFFRPRVNAGQKASLSGIDQLRILTSASNE